jgi:hypothetical protein
MSPRGARITVTYERREYLFRLARAVQLRSLRDFYYGRASGRGNFSPGEEKKGGRYRAIRLSMGYTRVMSRLPRGRSRVIRNG